MSNFDYDLAFSRNIGWFTDAEQQTLRQSTFAIAGSGGVGGTHALTLARFGVGHLKLADFDHYAVENFNRQLGATLTTVDRAKLDVISEMVRDVSPEMTVSAFPDGIQEDNVDDFLHGADVFIDGLDFFALQIRRKVFSRCRELGIPAVTAAPLGFGSALLCFTQDSMSFEQYFGFEGRSENEQFLRFLLGLAPDLLHNQYLMDPSSIDFHNRKGPSTIVGCTMSTSLATTTAIKLLLKRGDVVMAPFGLHMDAYLNKASITHLEGGHRNESFQQLVENRKAFYNIE